MNDTNENFFINLDALMHEQGINISILSERSGIPRTSLSSMINRRTNPGIVNLLSIAKALGTSVEALYGPTEKLHDRTIEYRGHALMENYLRSTPEGQKALIQISYQLKERSDETKKSYRSSPTRRMS